MTRLQMIHLLNDFRAYIEVLENFNHDEAKLREALLKTEHLVHKLNPMFFHDQKEAENAIVTMLDAIGNVKNERLTSRSASTTFVQALLTLNRVF